ncbi:MAG: DUF4827 domain-containing protein [Prevotella sp.]|jgi:hypothetical protein|nr:DUF4827 domain-containing protein [Prevotella sp.]MCI1282552.1 DUF4827 domain-containing protein [Prevotella sp.]
MKKITYILLLLVGAFTFVACDSTETYAEELAKERTAISKYIADSAVTVISETQFASQNYTTDVSKNEFVLFSKSGVYMQIIREGCGEKIKNGETCTVLCRFSERNLLTDSLQLTNNILTWAYLVDKMSVTDNSGTFTAAFLKESSLMYTAYSSTSVPSGWLVPLTYIKLGRPEKADEEIAKVRLIVPAAQGQYYANLSVYPCLYDLTYERGR